MTPAKAAATAWLVVLRRGLATRGLAEALVESFASLVTDREAWETMVGEYCRIDGYGFFVDAACSRFDFVIPRPRG